MYICGLTFRVGTRHDAVMDQSMTIDDILEAHTSREGPLLPILNDVQAVFGHVSEQAIRTIANALNLTRAEVHGVVSFYHDYKVAADARPVVKLCRAEACQARGVDALVEIAEGQTRVHVESVYCLGLCSVGPAALVGSAAFARLDASTFADLIAAQ
jgi:formate dehydrogenase subunit gamma